MKPATVFRSAFLFHVDSEVPATQVEEQLAKEPFQEELAPTKEARFGWVNPEHVLSIDFSDVNTWRYNQYVVLALRRDQRVIPKLRFDALVRERLDVWCERNNRERAPTAVRAEIREAVEAELLAKTLPTTRVWRAIWNMQDQWIAVQGCPQTVLDVFRKRFHRSFGLILSEAGFFDDEDNDLSAAFRGWLLRRADEGRAEVKVGDGDTFTWWTEGNLVLSREDERTAAPVSSVAASSALADGASVDRLTLLVKRADREYACTVGKNGRVTGLRLPVMVKGSDVAEQLYEATFLYEEFRALLHDAFEKFNEERQVQGVQGEAAEARWRKERLRSGWDALMERLGKVE